jgi:hypothetical protein
MRKWPWNHLHFFGWNCKMSSENQPWISENPDPSTKRESFILLFTAKIFYSYYRVVQQAIDTYLQLVQMKTSPKFIYGRKRYFTKYVIQNSMNWTTWIIQTKTYHGRTLASGWGCNATTFLILLNALVIVIVSILFLTHADPAGRKWLETRSFQEPQLQEPEVRIYDDQNTRYAKQEKRYETREPSALIKTAKIVDTSLMVVPPEPPTVSK